MIGFLAGLGCGVLGTLMGVLAPAVEGTGFSADLGWGLLGFCALGLLVLSLRELKVKIALYCAAVAAALVALPAEHTKSGTLPVAGPLPDAYRPNVPSTESL